MGGLIRLFAVVMLAAGFWFLYLAIATPSSYPLDDASAVQITQVYSEATYDAVIATAFFAVAAALFLFARPAPKAQDTAAQEAILTEIADNTKAAADLTRGLGRAIQQMLGKPREQ